MVQALVPPTIWTSCWGSCRSSGTGRRARWSWAARTSRSWRSTKSCGGRSLCSTLQTSRWRLPVDAKNITKSEFFTFLVEESSNDVEAFCPYLYNTIVVLGVLTEHDGTLAVRAEGGDQVGLEHRPQLEREVEDRCLNILPSFYFLVSIFYKADLEGKDKDNPLVVAGVRGVVGAVEPSAFLVELVHDALHVSLEELVSRGRRKPHTLIVGKDMYLSNYMSCIKLIMISICWTWYWGGM